VYLRTCGSFKSARKLRAANGKLANTKPQMAKKDLVPKSQIHKVPHLRKVLKSNKFAICGTYFRNLFSDSTFASYSPEANYIFIACH
jgi:hypothetical protein